MISSSGCRRASTVATFHDAASTPLDRVLVREGKRHVESTGQCRPGGLVGGKPFERLRNAGGLEAQAERAVDVPIDGDIEVVRRALDQHLGCQDGGNLSLTVIVSQEGQVARPLLSLDSRHGRIWPRVVVVVLNERHRSHRQDAEHRLAARTSHRRPGH
jgi:hypothetical protein